MADILIIDDDKMICSLLSKAMKGMGHMSTCALTGSEGMEQLALHPYDLVFLDVNLPDGSGLQLLPRVREAPSSPQVLIITGEGSPDGAEIAIRNGAWDYIQKHASMESMELVVSRALQYRSARASHPRAVSLHREGIVGNSTALRAALDVVAQAATTDSNVLITGETGAGKECFAWTIHKNSLRAERNFVIVDCTALPETLVESILFGHEKGAFTGAGQRNEGLVLQANGGTLFLDEIGELPLSVQKSFLRVLEERRFRPLGSDRELSSDFRLIAATNRDLDQMVADRAFREDLLFRLRSITLHVPALRERKEDVMELALHHMGRLCEKYASGVRGFSTEFVEALNTYRWPGNVRELFHALEHAFSTSLPDSALVPADLPLSVRAKLARSTVRNRKPNPAEPAPPSLPGRTSPAQPVPFHQARETHEREYLTELLAHTKGDITETCRLSQLSRSYLYALMKKHGLEKK